MDRLLLGLMLIIIIRESHMLVYTEQYCVGETFNPTCGLSEVVVIEKGSYGRMRTGRCVTRDYGNVDFLNLYFIWYNVQM